MTVSAAPGRAASSVRLSFLVLIATALGFVGCDQLTKLAAKSTLDRPYEEVYAPESSAGPVEFRYFENWDRGRGASRTPGEDIIKLAHRLSDAAVGAIVAAAMVGRRRRSALGAAQIRSWPGCVTPIAITLILAGSCSNVVDVVFRGYVIDFIHVRDAFIFNLADLGIFGGIGVLAVTGVFGLVSGRWSGTARGPSERGRERVE